MQKSPFLQSLSDFMRTRHYSKRTIESYSYWIKHFILFCGKQHPESLGEEDVERFLTYLAVERQVSPGTQALALNAIVFLKKRFLSQSLELSGGFTRATRARKLPVVLTREEVGKLLAQFEGVHYLMAGLLCGSGLRRIELVRLRVKDVDLDYKQLRVLFGKGGKHRIVTLAEELLAALKAQIRQVSVLLEQDLASPGFAGVWMPEALARKYPNAGRTLGWQYLFPASRLGIDPVSGLIRRHHHDEGNLNKWLKQAARRAGIAKDVSCHTLRHS